MVAKFWKPKEIISLPFFIGLAMLGFSLYGLVLYFPLSSKSINNIFYAVVAVPGFLWGVINRGRVYKFLRFYAWLLLPLLILTLAISHEPKDVKIFFYLVLFLFFLIMLEDHHVLGVMLPMLVGSIFTALLLSIAFFYWTVAWLSSGVLERLQYLLGYPVNPVYTATLMIMNLVFLWVFFLDERLQERGRWVHLGGFLGLISLVLVSVTIFQARSALVGFALFLCLYVIYKRAYTLVIGAILAVCGLLLVEGVREAVLARGLSYRPQIWSDAVTRVVDVCGVWLGCGNDGYDFLGLWAHAHSAYVSTFYEAGVIGAALFLLVLGLVFVLATRVRSKWILIAMVGWGSLITTTGGVFVTPHQPLWLYFWFPTLMAAIEVQQKRSARIK